MIKKKNGKTQFKIEKVENKYQHQHKPKRREINIHIYNSLFEIIIKVKQ